MTTKINDASTKEKIGNFLTFFGFFRFMEKMAWDGIKWGEDDCFPTNPDLVDILGRMGLDFEMFHFFLFCGAHISGFPGPKISKFQDFWISRFPPCPFQFIGALSPTYHIRVAPCFLLSQLEISFAAALKFRAIS